MKTEMKKGWEIKKFGEVSEILNGGTPKTNIAEYWDGKIHWITPVDLVKLTSPTVDSSGHTDTFRIDMKKIKLFLLIFLFGIIHNSYAQSNFELYETYMNSKRNSISFAPFNLLDIINPSLQIGYERMLNPKFALQIEGAYIINHSVENYLIDLATGVKDCEYSNKGYKIRGEFKYYFSKGYSFKPYLSAELFYLKNISIVMETFIASDTTVRDYKYYDDFITIDKQRFGLNLKIGFKLFAGENFYFEPHTGIGLVYRISKHFDRDNVNDEFFDGLLSFSSKAGKMRIPNLPLNLKIGYRF